MPIEDINSPKMGALFFKKEISLKISLIIIKVEVISDIIINIVASRIFV